MIDHQTQGLITASRPANPIAHIGQSSFNQQLNGELVIHNQDMLTMPDLLFWNVAFGRLGALVCDQGQIDLEAGALPRFQCSDPIPSLRGHWETLSF